MARYITQELFSSQKQSLEVFYKKGVLDKFAKFTGKNLCQRLWHRFFL